MGYNLHILVELSALYLGYVLIVHSFPFVLPKYRFSWNLGFHLWKGFLLKSCCKLCANCSHPYASQYFVMLHYLAIGQSSCYASVAFHILSWHVAFFVIRGRIWWLRGLPLQSNCLLWGNWSCEGLSFWLNLVFSFCCPLSDHEMYQMVGWSGAW